MSAVKGSQLVTCVAQVMGPGDSYLLHYERDINTFWADKRSLALGACFKAAGGARRPALKQMVPKVVHQPLWPGV